MGKYADKLDNIKHGHFKGDASYDGKPSGLLVATAEMTHAKNIANGRNETRLPSAELIRLAGNNNSHNDNKYINLDLLRDKSNSL